MKSRAKRIKKGTTQTGLSEPELREALARAAVFTRAQSFFPLGPRLDEVLASLSEKLNVAFNDAAASERERYVRALSAVGEFLIGFNGNDNCGLQFGKLAWAIRYVLVGHLIRKKYGKQECLWFWALKRCY